MPTPRQSSEQHPEPAALLRRPILRRTIPGTGRALAWTSAVLLPFAALALRVALKPLLHFDAPYLTFFLASTLTAGLGGFWPGLISLLLGGLCSAAVAPSSGFLYVTDTRDPFGLLRYLVAGIFVCAICHALLKARERAVMAERALRESEEIYRAIGESIPFGIWIADAAGRFLYVSDSLLELTNTSEQEWQDRGFRCALHRDDIQRVSDAWHSCLADGSALDVELRYRGRDGSYHPVLMRGTPVRGHDGSVRRWAGIHLDISRQKSSEDQLRLQAEELQRSNRDLEQFAFVASHDLREPLRMVSLYSELLVRDVQSRPAKDLKLYVGFIKDGVGRMDRLIRDLLNYSRASHEDSERERVDLRVALVRAMASLEPVIQENRAEITIGECPAVMASQSMLVQVFQNLLSNSLKYRRPEIRPVIHVSSERTDMTVTVHVKDNGIGFPQEFAEKIFKLFYRLNGAHFDGTGLGLAICRRMIERYGGTIRAVSVPGSGTTISFTLTAAEQELAVDSVQPQSLLTSDSLPASLSMRKAASGNTPD